MAGGLSLGALEDLVDPMVIQSETDLKAALDAIKSGKDVDDAHLLLYTQLVNQNSLTVNMVSSIVKERADTLKACCQKF